MVSYANTLTRIGDLVGARAVASEVLARFRSAFTPRNPVTLAAATNFATVLRLSGDRNEAYSVDQVTVRELSQTVGAEHPFTLAGSNGLAIDLALNHEVEPATEHFHQLVDLARRTLGEDHPDTLSFEANLGRCLIAGGRHEDGSTVRERALAKLNTDGLITSSGGWLECDIEPPES
jgi:hypothetical protein